MRRKESEPRTGKPSALLRWTGFGALADLERSASNVLAGRGFRVVRVGETIAVLGGEPATAARHCAHLPGVVWIGLGYTSEGGPEALLASLQALGERYLKRNSRFGVQVEVTGSKSLRGDLIGAANSRLLGLRRGTRIDERSPELIFHVALDRNQGVAAVEIRRGVGGVPTSTAKAFCLVSGGMHSSVVAWMAALAGFSVELVHLRTSEESVVEAGRLYSELSHRIDPTRLKLTLLTGSKNSPKGVLASWLKKKKGGGESPVFAGYHLECREEFSWRGVTGVVYPLLLFPEPEFKRVFDSLGLTGYFESNGLLSGIQESVASAYRVGSFGGARAELHEVVDSVK
ncbi:MAG: hypothetical protein E6K96_01980 [Thaumarchaeota archaeon]|nr:MAG: hypothetical protein E6K96_01980 [Nitrososphaerota archaeon]